jgi:hypothetical protein
MIVGHRTWLKGSGLAALAGAASPTHMALPNAGRRAFLF